MSEENEAARELRIDLKEIELQATEDGNAEISLVSRLLYHGATLYARVLRNGREFSKDELFTQVSNICSKHGTIEWRDVPVEEEV